MFLYSLLALAVVTALIFAAPLKAKVWATLAVVAAGALWASATAVGVLAGGHTVRLWATDVFLFGSDAGSMDPLSALFALIVSVGAVAAVLYSRGYLAHYLGRKSPAHISLHYTALATMFYAMLGVVTSEGGFSFLFFWELMTVASFLLILFDAERREVRRAALAYVIMMHVGFALLLIGFGLQDSLLPIVTKQSTELSHNDLTVTLSDPAAFTVEKGLTDALEGGQVENWAAVYSKSVTIYNADGESAGVSVVGAQTDSQLSRYVTFRTRRGHKAIPFEKDSVVLTEKTALNLGVEPGDSIWVENPDGERVEMTLTGVTENYMFTRLYVSNAQLQTLLGTQDIPWNTVYAQTRCDSAADRNTMRETLLACNYVTGASFTEDATSMFDNLIVSLNSVVVLIIVCAAALAAVVLYNLISVNLAERKKELATIKVLGFFDKEVYRYIFREIDLLALMGSCVGLLLGIPLHQFIIRTVEMDQLMFIRTIAPHSYLLSVALTMLFTLAVCFVMRRHVKKISMVESMKAPE